MMKSDDCVSFLCKTSIIQVLFLVWLFIVAKAIQPKAEYFFVLRTISLKMASRKGGLLALPFGVHLWDSLLDGLLKDVRWTFAHTCRAGDKLKHSV